jgi:hypothetical protein
LDGQLTEVIALDSRWVITEDARQTPSYSRVLRGKQNNVRSVAQRVQASTKELQGLEQMIVSGHFSPRILNDFRNAVNSIRNTAWAVQTWIGLQEQNRDPYSLITTLSGDRVRQATQIAKDLTLDLQSMEIDFELRDYKTFSRRGQSTFGDSRHENVTPGAQPLLKHPANVLRQKDPWFLAGRRRWVSCGGLAGGFAVTRGRQISVCYRSTLHCSFSGDLPTRVDAISVFKKWSITIVNEVVQLCHRAVLPKECAAAEGHIARISDDLASVVDP